MMHPQWQEPGKIRHEEYLQQAEEARRIRKLNLQNKGQWHQQVIQTFRTIVAHFNTEPAQVTATMEMKQVEG